jgi:hypothetical protein
VKGDPPVASLPDAKCSGNETGDAPVAHGLQADAVALCDRSAPFKFSRHFSYLSAGFVQYCSLLYDSRATTILYVLGS